MSVTIFVGDVIERLRQMDAESVNCVMTSIPYWGLRDYQIEPSVWGGDPKCEHEFADETLAREMRKGTGLAELGKLYRGGGHKQAKTGKFTVQRGFCVHCDAWRGCLGLEPTYHLFVKHIVMVFDEVWRVLRKDGVVWLNVGDCYATGAGGRDSHQHGGNAMTSNGRTVDWGYRSRALQGSDHKGRGSPSRADGREDNEARVNFGPAAQPNRMPQPGLKPKDLVGIPWRVVFALQDAGWWHRGDNVWNKLNPMPESTYDRPTRSHEFVFLLTKSGNTLCWRHDDGRWVWSKPKPDYRWKNRRTREQIATEPPAPKKGRKSDWFRINLWRGYDYFYDAFAIMEVSSPNSHARAARSRSDHHKNADGGPGNQSIAINSPVAGRYLPTPAGWDFGEGHHGSIHRDGRTVGIDNKKRRSKGAPNEWKPHGPNSRMAADQTPRSRKVAIHDKPTGPRPKSNDSFDEALGTADLVAKRNKRSVWSIATEPFKGAHFATFPTALITPCILAGCPQGGVVLDPFGGSGTTGLVAAKTLRNAVLIEKNPSYALMAETRLKTEMVEVVVNGEIPREAPGAGLPIFTPLEAAE